MYCVLRYIRVPIVLRNVAGAKMYNSISLGCYFVTFNTVRVCTVQLSAPKWNPAVPSRIRFFHAPRDCPVRLRWWAQELCLDVA
jgi:hypothetical protein